MAEKILLIGATSAIARETARIYASRGAELFLMARDAAKLEATAADLRIRGARKVEEAAKNLLDRSAHEGLVEEACTALGGLDAVLIFYGILGDQRACQHDSALACNVIETNFVSVVSLLTPLANFFERKRGGCIVVVGSVAGDRGRQSNYVYGASKAGLHAFLSGLRGRLHHSGVRVITVKPGLVDTPMTAGMDKNFLFASPDAVASGIVRSVERHRDVVYIPWFWRYIMSAISLLPETVFKRLRL